jgi:hypothetical protein
MTMRYVVMHTMHERRPGNPRIPYDVVHAEFDTREEAEAALSQFREYGDDGWIETVQTD